LTLEIRRIAAGGGFAAAWLDAENKPYNTDFVKTLWRFTTPKAGFNSRL